MLLVGANHGTYLDATVAAAADSTELSGIAKPEFDPAHAEKMQAGLDLFRGRVREVLIAKCVDCHGGEQVLSGLDLATRKGLLRGGSHGAAVVVGKANDSRLYRLIAHLEQPRMPEGGDRLVDDEVAAIREWIDLGAPYDRPLVDSPRDPDAWMATVVPEQARQFWAFRPLRVVTPPAVAETVVDDFVLAAREQQGLSGSQPATRRTLIRRASFDLLGLPPTPQELHEFEQDQDPAAFEKLVDRLLASPHYGVRWGRYWLDVARYAESHGFEQDYDRPFAYHFRDFVIEALNRDMPFDQFVRWQIAGDEAIPRDPLALKATGFLGAGVFPTQITANEVERTRYDALDDMAATTGSAFLGLSVGCARCHDHKFDPIPQADYYRLISTFATTVRANVEVDLDPAGYAAALARFHESHRPLIADRERFEQEQLPARFSQWEAEHGQEYRQQAAWQTLTPATAVSAAGTSLVTMPDGSIVATGKNPDFETYTLTFATPLTELRGLKLDVLAVPSLVNGGPGRATNGNFDLTHFVVAWRPRAADPSANPASWQAVTLVNPRATFEQAGLPIAAAIDGNPSSGWAVDPQFGRDHAATFEFAEPIRDAAGLDLQVTLDFRGNNQHNIGHARISVTSMAGPPLLSAPSLPAAIAALARPPVERSADEQSQLLRWYGAEFDEEWRRLDQLVVADLARMPQPRTTQMMVCSEGVTPIRHHTQGADFFTETYFLKRGDCDQKMGVASPGFLQVLMLAAEREQAWQATPPEGATTSYRRTGLANWLVDVEHGAGALLARVIVNRFWQHHFGRGLVATPNDFGAQGQPPTHPELLDWLAADLIRSGWSLKRLHRQLMLTAVYQQSSRFDVTNASIDPENRYLWRRTPRRLEAEAVRDNLLAVSGLLDDTFYGPGTLDENHRRRSIYFMIKRSRLISMLQLFDQPEPLVSIGERPSTTIAPQALLLMNHPQVRTAARALAQRLLKELAANFGSDADQTGQLITAAYEVALGRLPAADELADAREFLASQSDSYAARPETAGSARELAVADFCQVLFELNEFVFVDQTE